MNHSLNREIINPHLSRRIFGVAVLIALLTFVTYLPALNNGFVNWDDNKYVYENEHIHPLDCAFIKWSLGFRVLNWHPLTLVSHSIDYAFWGLDPLGHHLGNVLLHSFNVFLLFVGIVILLNGSYSTTLLPEKKNEYVIVAAVITSLLFGIHPMHVESVAWISERKDVLSTFFMLLSLICYMKYAGKNKSLKPSILYFLCMVFFVLSLMSKPMTVTLPLILLILDVYPFQRLNVKDSMMTQKKVLIEKIPFLLFSLCSILLTVFAQKAEGALTSLKTYPLDDRIVIAFNGLVFYVGKILLPVSLYPYYPMPSDISLLKLKYFLPLVTVTAITFFCIWAWRKGWKIFMAVWLYYVITLFPVIGVIQVGEQAVADRYSYIPSMGPFLLIGIGISRFSAGYHLQGRLLYISKKVISAIAVVFVVLLCMLTVNQISVWRDSVTLWGYELEGYPELWLAYHNRGHAYLERGEYRLNKSISQNPKFADSYYLRAIGLIALNEYRRALDDIGRAESMKSQLINESTPFKCYIHHKLDEHLKSVQFCTEAIFVDGSDHAAYSIRGLSYSAIGKYEEALSDFTEAIKIHPEEHKYYSNRGTILSGKADTGNGM
jgi:hypothetical protein